MDALAYRLVKIVVLVMAAVMVLTGCGGHDPQTWQEHEAASCEVPINWDPALSTPVDYMAADGPRRIFPFERADGSGRYVWVYGRISADGTGRTWYVKDGVDCDKGNPWDFGRTQG